MVERDAICEHVVGTLGVGAGHDGNKSSLRATIVTTLGKEKNMKVGPSPRSPSLAPTMTWHPPLAHRECIIISSPSPPPHPLPSPPISTTPSPPPHLLPSPSPPHPISSTTSSSPPPLPSTTPSPPQVPLFEQEEMSYPLTRQGRLALGLAEDDDVQGWQLGSQHAHQPSVRTGRGGRRGRGATDAADEAAEAAAKKAAAAPLHPVLVPPPPPPDDWIFPVEVGCDDPNPHPHPPSHHPWPHPHPPSHHPWPHPHPPSHHRWPHAHHPWPLR
jgi:hypothetical protein